MVISGFQKQDHPRIWNLALSVFQLLNQLLPLVSKRIGLFVVFFTKSFALNEELGRIAMWAGMEAVTTSPETSPSAFTAVSPRSRANVIAQRQACVCNKRFVSKRLPSPVFAVNAEVDVWVESKSSAFRLRVAETGVKPFERCGISLVIKLPAGEVVSKLPGSREIPNE